MAINKKAVTEVAKLLGIRLSQVRAALGDDNHIKLVQAATTIEELGELYHVHTHYRHLDARPGKLAGQRLNLLVLAKLKKASSIRRVRELYSAAPQHSKSGWQASRKLNTLILFELEKAATVQRIRELHYAAGIIPHSKARQLAFRKWLGLCTTIQQLGGMVEAALERKETQRVLRYLNSLILAELKKAATIQQVSELFKAATDGSEAKQRAKEKLNSLILAELKKASSIAQAINLHHAAPYGSKSKWLAFRKWLSLCTTVEQLASLHVRFSSGGAAERMVISKMYKLCCAAAASAG